MAQFFKTCSEDVQETGGSDASPLLYCTSVSMYLCIPILDGNGVESVLLFCLIFLFTSSFLIISSSSTNHLFLLLRYRLLGSSTATIQYTNQRQLHVLFFFLLIRPERTPYQSKNCRFSRQSHTSTNLINFLQILFSPSQN